jgi:integrase
MPTKKLAALSIPTLAPGEWYDTVLPGLILRVGARRRTWSFRYHGGGSYHRKPLGHYPSMPLAEARVAARSMIERIDSGASPEPSAPHPRSPDALTLGALLDRYEAMRIREGQKIRTLAKSMRLLRHQLRPYLGLPAAQFSKADLRNARNALVEAGTIATANRMLATIGPALRWASEEDLVPVNFTSAIRRTPGTKRERVLAKQEIKAIWQACGTLDTTEVTKSYAKLVRFLLLTAQRRDEAASLRHGHILDGTWKQTANKASRPHSLPLPLLALSLVGRGEARDLVFAGRGGGKIGAFSTMKRMLDKASGVPDWRLHDLRRTAATNMQELGIRNEVVQAILNHAVPGVGGVYLRSELEKQKAEALATWAAALTKIVGPLRVTA